MSTTFTIAEASKLLGISERAVKHYRAIYTTEVIKEEDGRVYLTQKFLDKVKNTRSLDSNTITDSRTKAELLKEIEVLTKKLKDKKDIIKDYKNRPNKDLIKAMDLIIQDFDFCKKQIIELSLQLDKLENTYNTLLKEYDGRRN